LKFKIVKKKFASIEEAKLWILRNQLGRRNLTDEQRSYVIGKIYEILKREKYRPKKENNSENFSEFSGATVKSDYFFSKS